MNTKLFLMAVVAVFLLVAQSCKDDPKDTAPVTEPGEFNTLSVEENKQKLEDAGIDLVNEMDELRSSKTVEASVSLADLMDLNSEMDDDFNKSLKKSAPFQAIYMVREFSKGNNDALVHKSALKSVLDDPETLAEAWNEIKGVYEWDNSISDFEQTGEAVDKVVFKFPAEEGSTENKAVFTIYKYKAEVHSYEDLYDGEVPTEIKADLKVDGETTLEYILTASYDNEGMPTEVLSTLKVDNYAFYVESTGSNTESAMLWGIKKDSKILIDMGTGATGDFSYDNMESKLEDIDNADFDEMPEIEKIIQSISAHFQLMDVRVNGEMDVVKVMQGYRDIDNEWELGAIDDNQALDKFVDVLNINTDFSAFYTTDGSKIADLEFYTYTETNYYTDYIFDESTFEWVETQVEDEYTNLDLRFVFADGSMSDAETYFSSGFEQFENEVNKMISRLNADFNSDIDPIDIQ